ncbi:hypothetical protein Ancab_026987 [Ancistrocladus abbreviatus]
MAMGETTCVMHAFSYTSTSSETNEGDPMYGLGESVSFGRFMSESLAWEKWSSFSRNRYVEEAEKYSKPGSVAQKKAYFEAHFKRMAALKAAALLEQAKASQDASQAKVEGKVADRTSQEYDAPQLSAIPQVGVKDQESVHSEGENERSGVDHNAVDSIAEKNESFVTGDKEADSAEQFQSSGKLTEFKNFNGRDEMELTGLSQMKKPSLQNSDSNQDVSMKISKKNPPLSSFMPSVESRGLLVSSPAKSLAAVHPGKENYYTPIGKKLSVIDDPDKKRTPLRMSINRELNKLISPVIKKIAGSSKAPKDCCSTPLKTPAKDSSNNFPNPPPATPQSAKKGAKRLFNSSAHGSKPVGARWNSLSEDGSKSPRTSRNKANSPIIPKSFCLRSSERAGRRKKKLEEKFDAKATEKPQHQSKLKEKAEAELTKLRGSFCFNAKPPSDNCDQTEALRSPTKKSPNKGRKPSSNTLKGTNCLPPRSLRPVPIERGPKHVQQKNG